MTRDKPHFRVICNRPVQVEPRETKLEAAHRRHGKPFSEPWPTGEGPRFWTIERVGRLKASNEELRMMRKRRS